MRRILSLDSIGMAPPRDVVLRRQGIPKGHRVSPQVESVMEGAMAFYESVTRPKGLLAEIPLSEFEEVFAGEGRNTLPAPLPEIVKKADALALFACTIGEPVSSKIQELFEKNDPATACMLDGIASERTETAIDLLAEAFLGSLKERGIADSGARVLPYSPGYCGWHITGQRKLFSFLHPEQIGITLSRSYLMSPIKSVSGVLVAGKPEVHDFENDFEFCFECDTQECRARIALLLQPLLQEK